MRRALSFTLWLFLLLLGSHVGAAAPGSASYTKAWARETETWNQGVVVAPWGDVLALSSRSVGLYSRDTGEPLFVAGLCDDLVKNGHGFQNDQTLAVVCAQEIDLLFFPERSSPRVKRHRIVSLAEKANTAAVAGGVAAVSGEKGTVTIYSLDDSRVVDSFTLPGKIKGLALSPDGGKLAIGFGDDRLLLRDVRAKATSTLREGGAGEAIIPLCFSADGTTIFGGSGGFEAAVYTVSTGRILARWRTGSWLTTARFLSTRLVAAAGDEGLKLYGDREVSALLTGEAAEGTGASADGTLLCSGDRAGVLTCFTGEPTVAAEAWPASREDVKTPPITASTSSQSLAAKVVWYGVLGGLAILFGALLKESLALLRSRRPILRVSSGALSSAGTSPRVFGVALSDEAVELARAARRRLRFGRVANILTAMALLSVVLFACLEVNFVSRMYWLLKPSLSMKSEPFAGALLLLFLFVAVPITLGGLLVFYFVPAVVSVPAAALALALWRHPPVILFLRPFQRAEPSRALKRLSRRALSGFGFCYTLGDRDIRQRWYLRYPVLLGQLSFFQFRLGRLRTHKAVDRLCHSMRRRFLRSVNWTVSYSKVFAVRSADSCWQYAVGSLLARADLVVFELSGPSTNVRWELEECVRRGIVARVAFLAQDVNRADAMQLLAEYGIQDDSLLCYRDARDLFVEEALFFTAAQKLARPLPSFPTARSDPPGRLEEAPA